MKNKRKLLLFVILIVIICLLLILSFRHRDNGVDKECIDIKSNSTSLVINKPIPLDDEVSKQILSNGNNMDDSSIYLDFEINSKKRCHYKLLIDRIRDANSLKDEHVKILLLDGEKNKIIKKYDGASYLTLDQLDKYSNSYVVHEGYLSKNKTKRFKLLMWTSDKYVVSEKKKYFNGELSVYSY